MSPFKKISIVKIYQYDKRKLEKPSEKSNSELESERKNRKTVNS